MQVDLVQESKPMQSYRAWPIIHWTLVASRCNIAMPSHMCITPGTQLLLVHADSTV